MTLPPVFTERLELRAPVRSDIAAMFAILSEPATARFLGAASSMADNFTRFARNAGSWQLFGYGSFMLRLRETGEVIGNCGIFHSYRGLGEDFDDSPEAGWILRSDCTGQGIAREAMEASIAWFEAEHGKQRIVCMIAPENTASIALADRLGFKPIRDTTLPDGDAVRLFERRART